MDYLSIKNWSADERPREKLLEQGPRALSNAEILAIILGSGTREISAVELARKVLALAQNNLNKLGKLTAKDLMKIKGIGEAKAISIVSALELGRRRKDEDAEQSNTVSSSKDVFEIFSPLLSDLAHEEFWVAFLNRSNRLIEKTKISQGGISGTVIDNRLIMKQALDILATSVILCHNHPSGNLQPSVQDKHITSKLKEATAFFDIQILDHVIIANNKYLSFADEGLLS